MVSDAPSHTVLDSTFPVVLPRHNALFMSDVDFHSFVRQEIAGVTHPHLADLKEEIRIIDSADSKTSSGTEPKAPFVIGLEKHEAHHRTTEDLSTDNQTLTENLDVTNISSQNPLVDLFYDLGENTGSNKLKTLLEAAWKEDAALTLKIIFNARSIHLGKSNKVAAYKAFGWLAENHPLTLLTNLPWLVRPVIAKKTPKPEKDQTQSKAADDDFDMIDAEEADPNKAHDIRYGVSHGYWKDLLNLVVFAANDQLKFDGDPASLLNIKTDDSKQGKRKRNWDQATAKEARRQWKKAQNDKVQCKLREDPLYRALHFTVARLFATQVKEDKANLESGKKSDLKKLSLAPKWSPTFGEFHDRQTFILSSIAEILYPDPASFCDDATNRELYLRVVRERYRKEYTSPLRKALSVVERDIAANTFDNIKYDRVPSLAMDRYAGLFMKKDLPRFKSYVQDVAKGSAKISGATLLPSTLISKARNIVQHSFSRRQAKNFKGAKLAVELEIPRDIIDGQWNTLLQRVRDAGTLTSSIAVCDVSGSMGSPQFKDGSCPMDSAIGLSLLIASVTSAPFGSGFITFHEEPSYLSLKEDQGLVEKVRNCMEAPWGGSTNFVAVFEDVILPMAVKNKLKQEDMVKQVFVFSDMQFDQAQYHTERWTTSYEHIKQRFSAAGYEVPRLIFWNLADGSSSKPTTMEDIETALVRGYSQGMLRAFLESGAFDDEEELEEVEEEGEDGVMEVKKVKKKIDPLSTVRKAVQNKAYDMLEVVD